MSFCFCCGAQASRRLGDCCEATACREARVQAWLEGKRLRRLAVIHYDDEFGALGMDSGGFCRYCGDPADTVDHLLPRAWTGEAQRSLVDTVPACRECNSALGDSFLRSIIERREHVREHLRRKYRRILDLPVWTEPELAELDHSLRTRVEDSLARREWIMDRLRWPQSSLKYREDVSLDGYGRPMS